MRYASSLEGSLKELFVHLLQKTHRVSHTGYVPDFKQCSVSGSSPAGPTGKTTQPTDLTTMSLRSDALSLSGPKTRLIRFLYGKAICTPLSRSLLSPARKWAGGP